MIQKKNFLHPSLTTFEIPRFRIVVGLIIGAFYSFVFYSFQFVLREGFRLLSVNEDYDVWILSAAEVRFYNLFFAFISVIIGQSICFSFWFDRPKRQCSKLSYKRSSILNDQRVLNWYFLFWFLKMSFVYTLFFCLYSGANSNGYSFYSDFGYLFILIIIVLFLQTWNTIRQLFKRRSTKWLVVSIIAVSTVAFGLSRINIVDYEAINRVCNKKNIHYDYCLELPESDFYEKLERRSLVETIYFVERKKQSGEYYPVILIDNHEVKMIDLQEEISKKQSERDEFDRPYIVYQLNIHRKIKMSFVRQLKKELSLANVRNIAYSVSPTSLVPGNINGKNCVSKFRLPPQNDIFSPPPPRLSSVENLIEVKYSDNTFSVNKKQINFTDLKDEIKKKIRTNLRYVIKLYVSDSEDYEVYLKAMICIKKAVYELRDEYCMEKFAQHYDDFEGQKEIQKEYRISVMEMTPEMEDY